MPSSLHTLFQSIFLAWLQSNTAPDAPIEGATPELTDWLGTQPKDFTFDAYQQLAEEPEWGWQAIEFSDMFDGQFFFYVPTAWAASMHSQVSATFEDAHAAPQQAISLVSVSTWQAQAHELLTQQRVVAFTYYPLFQPYYHQWVFVTAGDASSVQTYGVFSSGDWLIVAEGSAPQGDAQALSHQLTVLVNSNPWYGWLQAAKRQKE
jgi:hypothetical protein